MPYVIILCGPPGSGKTTYVNEYLSDDFITLSLDAIVFKEATRVGKSYADIWQDYVVEAENIYYKQLDYAINNNLDIVIDKTHLTEKSRKKTLINLPSNYTKIAIYFPAYTPESLSKRIANRVSSGGHSVPLDVVESMHKSYKLPQKTEGFDLVVSSSHFIDIMKVMNFR